MKKLILILFIIVPLNIKALSAKSSIVMDIDSGRILHSNNINEKMLIASTSKIMTAIIAIEYGDLNKLVTIDKDVLKAYGSAIYIEVGEQIKLIDLIYGLMLRSGNDAAIEIANAIAGNMKNFTNLMNLKANELHLTNTIFYNAHGLEEQNGVGNTSTAKDMALLMKYAMNNKVFKKITGCKKYQVKTNYKTYIWHNKNRLLQNLDFITGGKTGFTKKARRTLVTTGKKDNLYLVIVTLNDPFDFKDHETLYNYYFNNYESLKVLDKDDIKIKKYHNIYLKNDIYIPIRKEEKDNVNIKYEMYRNKLNNNSIGIAKVYIGNELITKENIYQRTSIKPNYNIWDKFLWWFKSW